MEDKSMAFKEGFSNTIRLIRFPLSVLIVAMHCDVYGNNLFVPLNSVIGITPDHSFVFYLIKVISGILSRVAVPFFFFISGYLFFLNIKQFGKDEYLYKLKKRFKTLFIPYLAWCVVAILIALLHQKLNAPYDTQLFDKSLPQLFVRLFADPSVNWWHLSAPSDGPLWFIRDLFCMVLVSPFIYFMVKRVPWALILILIAWMSWRVPTYVPGFSLVSILFFSAGAWVSANNINILALDRYRHILLILMVISIVADICILHYDSWYPDSISAEIREKFHDVMIILIILNTALWGGKYAKGIKISKTMATLSAASFVIYALHTLIMGDLVLLAYHTVGIPTPPSHAGILALYLYEIIGCIAVATLLYIVLSKFKITRLLFTGDR